MSATQESTDKAVALIDGASNWSDVQYLVIPKVAAMFDERERLREALRQILKEAEFVGDAKQPFSTWIAEKCRAALSDQNR